MEMLDAGKVTTFKILQENLELLSHSAEIAIDDVKVKIIPYTNDERAWETFIFKINELDCDCIPFLNPIAAPNPANLLTHQKDIWTESYTDCILWLSDIRLCGQD